MSVSPCRRISRRAQTLLWACVLCGTIGGVSAASAASGTHFAIVAEMEPLEGIVAQPRRERQALAERSEGQQGLKRLAAWARAEWRRIRQVDLVALSRFQIEATEGFELPTEPGELKGRIIGHDEATGLWYLELRGPRLPARYDIVYRYLYLYASFDPARGELDQLTVTIRGWVLE